MAGTSLLLAGASFTNYIASLTLPDRTALIEEYIFGTNDARAKRNIGRPSSPATVVGTPAYEDHYALVSSGATFGDNGFRTGFVPSEPDQTWIVIAKPALLSTGAQGQGGLNSTTNLGLVWGYKVAGQLMFAHGGTSASNQSVSLPVPSQTDFFFAAGAGKVGGVGKLYVSNGSGGLTTALTTGVAGARPTSDSNMISAGAISGSNGKSPIAYAARFSRVLTDAEIETVRASLFAFYAGKIIIK